MSGLPTPGELGLPATAVIAVPAEGLALYRLIRGARPAESDFRAAPLKLARSRGYPELLRLGMSHFLTTDQALAARRRLESRVVEVVLTPDVRAYVARTGRTPGHVTVWGAADVLLAAARLVA